MTCRQIQNWIQLEFDGELPAVQADLLTKHVESCETCRRMRVHMRSMSVALTELAVPADEQPRLRFVRDVKLVHPWRIPLAAAASIAMLLASWMAIHPRTASTTSPLAARVPHLHTAPPIWVAGDGVSLAKNRPSAPEVHVWISPNSNVIALPVETRNPNITILKIYPKLQLAESAGTPGAGGT